MIDPDTPLRMVCGTIVALAFLWWVVRLVDGPVRRDTHPTRMSDEWRRERAYWRRDE